MGPTTKIMRMESTTSPGTTTLPGSKWRSVLLGSCYSRFLSNSLRQDPRNYIIDPITGSGSNTANVIDVDMQHQHSVANSEYSKSHPHGHASVQQANMSAQPDSPPPMSKTALIAALSKQKAPSKQEIGLLSKYFFPYLTFTINSGAHSVKKITSISVQASVAKCRSLADLLDNSGKFQTFIEAPVEAILNLDLSPKAQSRGGFKITAFGTTKTPLFDASLIGAYLYEGFGYKICAKRSFYEKTSSATGLKYVCVLLTFFCCRVLIKTLHSTYQSRRLNKSKTSQQRSSVTYGRML